MQLQVDDNFRSLQVYFWFHDNTQCFRLSENTAYIILQVTKCLFHKYGPSGSIQQHDALCVMALNIIHEKIYTVLWFWFLFLFIMSVLGGC